MRDLERSLALALVEPSSGRKKYTATQRCRALQTILERLNPEREPELHSALFDVYLDLLKEALHL